MELLFFCLFPDKTSPHCMDAFAVKTKAQPNNVAAILKGAATE